MSVKFLTHTPSTGNEKLDVPTEFIEVTFAPVAPGAVADVMFRPATVEDQEKYKVAYRAFIGAAAKSTPAPEPEVSTAKASIFSSHKKKG